MSSRPHVSRPPMERMMHIHSLLQNRQYPNCTLLGRELEVRRRTILRDLDFMRFRLNLPIEFDPLKNGYHYTRPVHHFPALPMNEQEVFALLVAHKTVRQYRGTPFYKPLDAAFRKLTGQLDASLQYTLNRIDEVLSFRPFAPEDGDAELFQLITRGLHEHRVLEFEYRNRGTTRFQPRQAEPRHLACIDNHWYLFALDRKRQAMRTFALARLRALRLTRRTFKPGPRFVLNDYLQGSLAVFKGDRDYAVVIDLDPWAADEVRRRHWHPSQTVTELPGGLLRLELRLNNLEEVERWVLGLGTHATVVRPQALADRIARVARTLARRYDAPAEETGPGDGAPDLLTPLPLASAHKGPKRRAARRK